MSGSKRLVTEQAEPTAINSKSDADWLLLCFYSKPLPFLNSALAKEIHPHSHALVSEHSKPENGQILTW